MTLVTGASGFIGSHLVQKLTAAGERVRCLVRRQVTLPRQAETAYGDLSSGQGLDAALHGVDTVIHLAGVTKALSARDYYTGNARATETLARALSGHTLRLVHVSSLAAIGPSSAGAPLDEDADPHPLTSYGKSKLEAERLVRQLVPDAVIVRPPVVYGPRDTDVFQLLRAISKGVVLEISGGERWFSAIYVEDLVEGLIAAVRSPNGAGRAYFLAYPKPASWGELSLAAARIMGRTPRVLRIAPAVAKAVGICAELWARAIGRPGIISREKVAEAQCTYWTCDTRRAAAELGFQARTPLEAGLAQTLAWYKEAGWLSY
ncbi:NAD-dependent epimerase/dehydratase [Candidatus Sulfopaludibacter sp. SbA3]|nr:NAD-dependent epimerase/dehydratase [Candidatus Sulfopaludibacter sp. SbA3]